MQREKEKSNLTLLKEDCIINSSYIVKELTKTSNIKDQLHLIVILGTIKYNLENINSNIYSIEVKNSISIELESLKEQLKVVYKIVEKSKNNFKWFFSHQELGQNLHISKTNILTILGKINKISEENKNG